MTALLLSLAGTAGAVETYSPCAKPSENPAILAVNNSVSLAYLNSNLDYIEPSDSNAFNTGANYDDYEEGSLNGVRASASWMSQTYGNFYLHGEFDWSDGSVNYTGFTQD